MAVRLRLQRYGSTHHPFYRLVAAESTRARDGKFLALLGTYDPMKSIVNVDVNELNRWFQNGALPTDTVRSLLRKHKIELSRSYKVVTVDKKEVKPAPTPVKKKVTKTAPKKEAAPVKPQAETPKQETAAKTSATKTTAIKASVKPAASKAKPIAEKKTAPAKKPTTLKKEPTTKTTR